MKSRLLLTILVALFLHPAASHAKGQRAKPKEIPVDMYIRVEWVSLPPSAVEPGGATYTTTRSALRILRAINPETGQAYDNSDDVFGCKPTDLRRSFRSEKNDFLLGEPMLVEFRVGLEGPGEWRERIGGNYRARGRDDNFLFLMRHQDGTWVRDPYAPINVYMGGLSSLHVVKEDKPQPYWLAVQRWCAIDRPGKYDLYCFQAAHGHEVVGQQQAVLAGMPNNLKKEHHLDANGKLMDSKTGKRSERYSLIPTWRKFDRRVSPLKNVIPADVAAYAGKSWTVQDTADFAHFKIVIREGSKVERTRMVEQWTKVAESSDEARWPAKRPPVARQAICFAQQDDFLPLMKKLISTNAEFSDLCGLAMRPSPEATAILLRTDSPNAVSAMRYLHPDRIPDVIPQLIKWLTHENQRMRTESEFRLHIWTGQAFSRNWKGYDNQRPTSEEGREMQLIWQEWWEKNKNGFEPKAPR